MARERAPIWKNPSIRAFAVTFVVFTSGIFAGNEAVVRAAETSRAPYESLDTFARAITQIQAHYVEEVETPTLIWAAIEGMTNALDARTQFFDPETYRALRDDTEGTTSGIGVMVNRADVGGLLIVEVIARGPADLAELQVADRIVAVDGADIQTWTVEAAIDVVKGPRGTAVNLTVVRDDPDAPLQVEVVRDDISTPSVSAQLVEPGLGYLRLDQFRRHSGEEFLGELAHLESLDGGSLDAVVIDLRNNPGGLLDEAVVVVDHFVESGLIVETRGRDTIDERHEATAAGTDTETRVVVLIDGMSASASEIVAGALQDHDRATVVGSHSYGKGSVQTYFEYEDDSALALTIGNYYLPSGRHLERDAGIEPDVEVDLPTAVTAKQELVAGLESAEIDEAQRSALLELAAELPDERPEPGTPSFSGNVRDRDDAQLDAAFAAARE